jgi:hypothetical protein
LTVRLSDSTLSRVDELIDVTHHEWNVDVINANFVEPDISAIRQIPLGRFMEDTWAWGLEKNGNFTVRSAYKALITKHCQDASASSSLGNVKNCWKKLWGLEVPPKVKNFWWRVVHKYIPCRAVLRDRHMEHIACCESCGEEETIEHTLFRCPWTQIFWQELRKLAGVKVPVLHPDSWSMDIIDGTVVHRRDACMILCACWSIWTERNARRHGEQGRPIMSSVRWVIDTAMDLASAIKVKVHIQTRARWNPPEGNNIKINVDACFIDGINSGSTGLVMRDSVRIRLPIHSIRHGFDYNSGFTGGTLKEEEKLQAEERKKMRPILMQCQASAEAAVRSKPTRM